MRELIGRLRAEPINPAATAVVLVDLQVLDASSEGSQALRAKAGGQWDLVQLYFERVERVVMPAVHRLRELAQLAGMPTLFTRCVSQTADARDNGNRFRQFGIAVTPKDRDADLLPGLVPGPLDIIYDKTTASAFWSTSLERGLRQMGISTLLVGGVVTSGCVESLVRDACDLDFTTILLSDACADRTTALHEDALARLDGNFAVVSTVSETIRQATEKVTLLKKGAPDPEPASRGATSRKDAHSSTIAHPFASTEET